VINYTNRINDFVESLNTDARDQIVYQDASELESTASDYGFENLPSVTLLKKRAKDRGASQTSKDLNWDKIWNPFYIEWVSFNDDMNSSSPGIPPGQAWEKLQNYELQLRQSSNAFKNLGNTKLTKDISKMETLESPTGKKEDITGIPSWAYWVGGAALIILLISLSPSINALTVATAR
jgi:hypothetical protein